MYHDRFTPDEEIYPPTSFKIDGCYARLDLTQEIFNIFYKHHWGAYLRLRFVYMALSGTVEIISFEGERIIEKWVGSDERLDYDDVQVLKDWALAFDKVLVYKCLRTATSKLPPGLEKDIMEYAFEG